MTHVVQVEIQQNIVELTLASTVVEILKPSTTVNVLSGDDTSIELIQTENKIELLHEETIVIPQPMKNVVVISPTGVPGPAGPPGPQGPPGIGFWGPPELIHSPGTTLLDDECSNYIEIDCTDGDQLIELPNFSLWIGRSLRIVRVSAGPHLAVVTTSNGAAGIYTTDLAYLGESLEFTAQASGWWL